MTHTIILSFLLNSVFYNRILHIINRGCILSAGQTKKKKKKKIIKLPSLKSKLSSVNNLCGTQTTDDVEHSERTIETSAAEIIWKIYSRIHFTQSKIKSARGTGSHRHFRRIFCYCFEWSQAATEIVHKSLQLQRCRNLVSCSRYHQNSN